MYRKHSHMCLIHFYFFYYYYYYFTANIKEYSRTQVYFINVNVVYLILNQSKSVSLSFYI